MGCCAFDLLVHELWQVFPVWPPGLSMLGPFVHSSGGEARFYLVTAEAEGHTDMIMVV